MNKQWTGPQDGLPPVGTVCEFTGHSECPEDPTDNDLHRGAHVKIIAHFNDGDLELAAFTFNPKNKSRGSAVVEQGACGCFRPIRTPEQIAAEERDKAIEEMWNVYWQPHAPTAKAALGLLYDAGYRKQPTTPPQDMTDWRNWKAGDLVECVNYPCRDGITVGTTYELIDIGGSTINFLDDDGDYRTRSSSNFRWHSRPSA